jgi:hypothetical protein
MNARITPSTAGGNFLGFLLHRVLGRWTRRKRARRQLEQVRADINSCAAISVSSTQGGTVPLTHFPTDSTLHLGALHADGFLTGDALALLQEFFAPAEHANSLLTAPAQQDLPGANAAQRLQLLFRGKDHVEARDSNGTTLRDRALAEVAGAISAIDRQRW